MIVKSEIGEFTLKGFAAGIIICVVAGVLIFKRIPFAEQNPTVGVSQQVDSLEKQLGQLQKDFSCTQRRVLDLESKLASLEAKAKTRK